MKNNNLKEFEVFNNLDSKQIQLFTEKLEMISYKKNDIIMQEGEEGNGILFLIEGKINITKALTLSTNKSEINDTREKEFIRCKSSDNIIIGEVSLFSKDNKRTATVKALTNSQIGYLNKKDFFTICQEDKDAGYKVINNLTKIITQKLIDTNHQVLKLTTAFSLIIDN